VHAILCPRPCVAAKPACRGKAARGEAACLRVAAKPPCDVSRQSRARRSRVSACRGEAALRPALRAGTASNNNMVCKKAPGRTARHQALNDIICRAFISAGIPALKEPAGFAHAPDGKRPDGLSLIPWQNGKPLAWDVTVASTLAESYVEAAARESGPSTENNLILLKTYLLTPSPWENPRVIHG